MGWGMLTDLPDEPVPGLVAAGVVGPADVACGGADDAPHMRGFPGGTLPRQDEAVAPIHETRHQLTPARKSENCNGKKTQI